MKRDRLWLALLVIGGLVALASLVLGLGIGVGADWDDSGTGERVLWFVLTLGGAVLLAAGLWSGNRAKSMRAAALMSIGAVMAGVATFWSIVIPLAAIAVVVLSVIWARRPDTAAAGA